MNLTAALASQLAKLPLACVCREYPNKLDHALLDASDIKSPRQLHPAFYGCLDWHSAVHGHWTLVRVLRRFPDLGEAGDIRSVLDETLTAANIAVEVAYLDGEHRASFERTYGWAWLLELARELRGWNDPDGKRWSAVLQPLVDAVVARYLAFLPKQTYAIRTGVHANTAFGLALALDFARDAGVVELERSILDRANAYYAHDRDAPVGWEPGGEDFLSPSLVEADLMRRVLAPADFAIWVRSFLSELESAKGLLAPAIVSDRGDPKLAHLDGLNLSRAWCMRAIAGALPDGDALRTLLATAGATHLAQGLAHVATGDYMGEHWLATFAVYALR